MVQLYIELLLQPSALIWFYIILSAHATHASQIETSAHFTFLQNVFWHLKSFTMATLSFHPL